MNMCVSLAKEMKSQRISIASLSQKEAGTCKERSGNLPQNLCQVLF